MKRLLLLLTLSLWPGLSFGAMQVGTGMADITGPIAGLATMGYAAPTPHGKGLHQRLRARAFVVVDPNGERVAFVITDLCFVTTAVRHRVVEILSEQFGDTYSLRNVMITATHTHSAPGGYNYHKFYNIPAKGFSQKNFDVISSGIAASIAKAHRNLTDGRIKIASGMLDNATVNRSILAYEENPLEERRAHGLTIDPSVTVLALESLDGRELGMFQWFAIHGTSMEKDNELISGDNKGYAAALFESWKNTDYSQQDTFVAGFANSNAGDASPNVDRDVDGDGDWECAALDNFECAADSGRKQAEKARQLYDAAVPMNDNQVASIHRYVDFSNITVGDQFTGDGDQTTCSAAIGISMLAGSDEDGPGVGNEGVNCSTGGPLAQNRCGVERFGCQGEKPVILNPGASDPPGQPNVLPLQLMRIGELLLVAVPGEITTMAGRRLRQTLADQFAGTGVERVVIAGYANEFSSYIATREEYQLQHYEGASTLFGEWTLSAYRQEYTTLAESMLAGELALPNAEPLLENTDGPAREEQGPDRAPRGARFGDIRVHPADEYSRGDLFEMEYWGSNPNNDLRTDGSYYRIQMLEGDAWVTARSDWDWDTRLVWRKTLFGRHRIKIQWSIPLDVRAGVYRVVFNGKAIMEDGISEQYSGVSEEFRVR